MACEERVEFVTDASGGTLVCVLDALDKVVWKAPLEKLLETDPEFVYSGAGESGPVFPAMVLIIRQPWGDCALTEAIFRYVEKTWPGKYALEIANTRKALMLAVARELSQMRSNSA